MKLLQLTELAARDTSFGRAERINSYLFVPTAETIMCIGEQQLNIYMDFTAI